ncbi:bifunctional 3-(3-hydroxy-phenyl)propionate/3-hydroxycinnamic acid hydroxylase [Sphingomonas sp. AR_OL41]|nr:bifunctional 3-(3-hydroxy-phenyl)propionate/3-hydroxycinnamic acid hydroxylase [Sphingomonas sp. AR_OL41]
MDRPFAIIVGAGPVGLMLANLLGNSGARVLVLERRTEPYTVPRAIAYDAESLRLFQKIGLLHMLEPALERDVPVVYLNGAGRELMRMGKPERPYGHSQLGSFYQPEMEAVLRGGLARFSHVELRMGATVSGLTQDGNGARVAFTGNDGQRHVAEAEYVIGCDGGQSFVRDAAGIGFGGDTFAEKWLVVDCIDEGHGVREMQFFCDPARPALTLPVSRGRRRWEFLQLPGETSADLEREATVRRLIAGYAPNDRSVIERATVYTFHARYADRFRERRVLLAGDAAHVNPPFAGQGLNGGLRDAQNLAWKLDMVRRGIADDFLLDSYETERRPHVKAMTDFAIKLGATIMPTTRWRATVRDLSIAAMHLVPGHRDHVNRGGLLPRPRLAGGAIRGKTNAAGHMLVQPQVDGVLLDELIGPGWVALGVGADPASGLHSADCALLATLGARLIKTDSTALSRQIGQGRIAIVRPDRFIADVLTPDAAGAQLGWLATALSLNNGPQAMTPHDSRLARTTQPVTKAQDLAFVIFARPDLDVMERFLVDFGLKRAERRPDQLVMRSARGPGPAHVTVWAKKPGFIGIALRVRDDADLAALSRLPGASTIEPLDLPGGGRHVRLTDPAGFQVWAVAGQASIAEDPVRAPTPTNTSQRLDRINDFARAPLQPATVLRPGHCVLGAVNFFATARWYIETFGLIPSDVQYLSAGDPALTFMRCDRGTEPADHHTVVVAQNVTNGFSHAAFEVIDLDDVALGQEWLQAKGWRHAWGLGRHILGSQIFDYWRDPVGDKLEHYADGDLLSADVPTGWSQLTASSLYQWGPPVPADFEKPKITPALIVTAIRNVRQSPELDVARLRRLLSAISAPSRPWTK